MAILTREHRITDGSHKSKPRSYEYNEENIELSPEASQLLQNQMRSAAVNSPIYHHDIFLHLKREELLEEIPFTVISEFSRVKIVE